MAFIIVTQAQDEATKFMVNTEDIKYGYAVTYSDGSWRDRAKVRLQLRDGTELLIRETPNAVIAALGAITV